METDVAAHIPAARRAQLVRTAAAQFAAVGYERASLNQIIRACGLSKSSFYHVIPSKQALFDLVVHDLSHDLLKSVTIPPPQTFADAEFGFWERVERLLIHLTEVANANPDFTLLGRIYYLSDAPEGSDRALTRMIAAVQAWLGEVLTVGREAGAIRADLPRSLQSRLVFALLHTLDEWTIHHGADYEPAALTQILTAEFATLRRLLAPDPETVHGANEPSG